MERASTSTAHRPGDLAAALAPAALLVAALGLLGLAPLVLDASYRWTQHTTSEAAGQGVDGAWMTRAGFLCFSAAVLWLAHRRRLDWGQPGTGAHVAFGACMAAVAAFSLRSWEASADHDQTEDLLHSVAATTMGFAFALGVVGVAWRRSGRPRVLDLVALAASVVLPLAMSASPSHAGILQRAMFVVAALWYGREATSAAAPALAGEQGDPGSPPWAGSRS